MNKPDRAFILAAGMGKRLRPHTDSIPKPLVYVNGKALIDHALAKLLAAGVSDVAVNLHYMAPLLETHLQQRYAPRITFFHEKTLLGTGGGIKNVLPAMGDNPFYVVSGDSLWLDGPLPALARMTQMWNPHKMDMLILLQPVSRMLLTNGKGDYDLSPNGMTIRSPDKTGAHMWTSIRIVSPRIFDDSPDTAFSFLDLMDRVEAQGRLYGLVHDAEWHHISTPEELERVNAAYEGEKIYA